MKIKHLKVSNFRNLKEIDIKFGNINILTGRNSTGKTNLTQLLTNCLNINPNVESYFGKNIITYHKGIDSTYIETVIENDLSLSYYDNGLLYIDKPKFTYKHIISKNPLYSLEQSLEYEGSELTYESVDDYINKGINLEELNYKPNEKVYSKKFGFIDGFDGIIGNEELSLKEGLYLRIFKDKINNSIINDDSSNSFSNCALNIFNKVIDKNKELGLNAVKYIKSNDLKPGYSDFITAKFISLLADIQKNTKQFKEFNDDLNYFTDGILRKVFINLDGSEGSKGDIYVESPNGPRDIDFISAGSSLILYFVLLKNWLNLKVKSYKKPSIMIFDELDGIIHPSLLPKFTDLLKIISKDIQLFITSHSTIFIDNFDKEDVYLLKDIGSFGEKVKVKSNILSYKDILKELNENEKEAFENTSNSELYINGYIDSLFPVTFDKGVKK